MARPFVSDYFKEKSFSKRILQDANHLKITKEIYSGFLLKNKKRKRNKFPKSNINL